MLAPMQNWQQTDDHLGDLFDLEDEALRAALDATVEAGLPQIQVSAVLGRFLQVQARAIGARRILEIGTLAGYSSIWLARALPDDGRLITLELDPRHAEVARANIDRAGLADRAEVRVGPALDSLTQMAETGVEPFDMVFIDADKEAYSDYLEWSIRLAHEGTLIIADNVVRGGQIVDAASSDSRVQGIQRFNAKLAADERLLAGIVQTVGSKGHDGMALALVTRLT
jgi:caffeoyl-CoA O-methyltransferase